MYLKQCSLVFESMFGPGLKAQETYISSGFGYLFVQFLLFYSFEKEKTSIYWFIPSPDAHISHACYSWKLKVKNPV